MATKNPFSKPKPILNHKPNCDYSDAEFQQRRDILYTSKKLQSAFERELMQETQKNRKSQIRRMAEVVPNHPLVVEYLENQRVMLESMKGRFCTACDCFPEEAKKEILEAEKQERLKQKMKSEVKEVSETSSGTTTTVANQSVGETGADEDVVHMSKKARSDTCVSRAGDSDLNVQEESGGVELKKDIQNESETVKEADFNSSDLMDESTNAVVTEATCYPGGVAGIECSLRNFDSETNTAEVEPYVMHEDSADDRPDPCKGITNCSNADQGDTAIESKDGCNENLKMVEDSQEIGVISQDSANLVNESASDIKDKFADCAATKDEIKEDCSVSISKQGINTCSVTGKDKKVSEDEDEINDVKTWNSDVSCQNINVTISEEELAREPSVDLHPPSSASNETSMVVLCESMEVVATEENADIHYSNIAEAQNAYRRSLQQAEADMFGDAISNSSGSDDDDSSSDDDSTFQDSSSFEEESLLMKDEREM